jgi:hypothetical protein
LPCHRLDKAASVRFMRLRPIACALLLSLTCAGDALAFPGPFTQPCDMVPPASAQRPVKERFDVYDVPDREMIQRCKAVPGPPIYGCTFLGHGHGPSVILLNDHLTPKERACTLLYEKAHLPPNNWQDPAVESTMR